VRNEFHIVGPQPGENDLCDVLAAERDLVIVREAGARRESQPEALGENLKHRVIIGEHRFLDRIRPLFDEASIHQCPSRVDPRSRHEDHVYERRVRIGRDVIIRYLVVDRMRPTEFHLLSDSGFFEYPCKRCGGGRGCREECVTCGRSFSKAFLAAEYGRAGRRADAVKILNELKEESKHRYVSTFGFFLASLGAGETDRAYQYFEQAYQERSAFMPILRSPAFDALRSDARFVAMKKKVGLPD
jgi:hypothetical protein